MHLELIQILYCALESELVMQTLFVSKTYQLMIYVDFLCLSLKQSIIYNLMSSSLVLTDENLKGALIG